ncbi:4586_t:CDS:2 [Funneliformis mosseae]|uniref:4586_t:CDS:1 n=1 Tax=Funneliformis mosseae TaxID=27381 RepID=A0A9N9DDQ7_FUNMO|nr:4586_t:CDS:2 [Funneliformis mosseae]
MIIKDSSFVTSDLTYCEEDLFITNAELVIIPEQVIKKLILVSDKRVLAFENTETEYQKISYNQKIPELSLEAILIGSSEVIAYENRVKDVKSKNDIDDKSAKH